LQHIIDANAINTSTSDHVNHDHQKKTANQESKISELESLLNQIRPIDTTKPRIKKMRKFAKHKFKIRQQQKQQYQPLAPSVPTPPQPIYPQFPVPIDISNEKREVDLNLHSHPDHFREQFIVPVLQVTSDSHH
jgi:hypothetical protein